MQFEAILSSLQDLKSQITRSHGVRDLAVFGSIARGDAKADSDIDLLVTFVPGTSHGLSFYGLQNLIAETLGRNVDLVTIDEIHPTMRSVVLNEARYV